MIALINRLTSFSLVLILITTGYGCTDLFLPDKGNEGQPCLDNGECKPGLVCQDNKCVEGSTDGGQTCESDAECDDDKLCTVDSCVGGSCENTNLQNGTECDDDNTCTQDDACSDGVCRGTDKDCSHLDGLCKQGVCFPENGQCLQADADDGDDCEDGLYCTTGDQCQSGNCVGGARDCDDNDVCTKDDCDEVGDECQNVLDPNAGTTEGPVGDETCGNGLDDDCDGQTDLVDSECVACTDDGDCDDGNACTTDTCAAGQCTYQDKQNGTACDDTLDCTENDACLAGVCTGSAMDCSHLSDSCNDGVCSEAQKGCITQPKANGTACDDGLYCTVPDQCSNGVCQLDARDCDDANSCTTDSCDESNDRCVNTWVPIPGAEGPYGDPNCDNGLDDDCDSQTDLADSDCVQCQSPNDCDDTNPCTLDECNSGECTNTPQTGQSCDDGDDCTHTDQCTGAGTCRGTTISCQDDPPPCGVVRTCNGTATCDETYPDSSVTCDDSNICTYDDRCDGAGSCAGTLVTCQDDPDVCGYRRSCNGTATCEEVYPGVETNCDDTDLCTYNDACNGSGGCEGTVIECIGDPGPCGVERACNGTDNCDESYPDSSITCDDGNLCTHDDRCDGAGACLGTMVTCIDDPGACALKRSCNGTDQCDETYPDIATSCEDGQYCTAGDHCDGSGFCVGGAQSPCETGWDCWEDEDRCCQPDAQLGCGSTDNDVYYFDSCGHQQAGPYENCPDPNGECVAGACQCRNFWTGQDCQICPDGFLGQDCDVCVRYVDVSAPNGGDGLTWNAAFGEVQLGVDAAYAETQAPGGPEVCEVWVAKGNYFVYQNSREDTIQLKPGIHIYGGFAGGETDRDLRDWVNNWTVLDGYDSNRTIRVCHVVTGSNEATIDGFVISNGDAIGANGCIQEYGGGLLNDAASTTVANCVFVGNNSDRGGGISNLDSSPSIVNCHFTRNSGYFGGAMYNDNSFPAVGNCLFVGNWGYYGGGMDNHGSSNSLITNSVFAGNWVHYNGAGMIAGGATLKNCTFFGNYLWSSGEGSGLAGTNTTTVVNSVLWDDDENQVVDLQDSSVAYCDVFVPDGGDPPSGTGNINADPGFTWVENGQWSAVSYSAQTNQTTLQDNSKSWADDELVGLLLHPDTAEYPLHVIISNTSNTIGVWGNLDYAQASDIYEILDLHLSPTSPCIDAGNACDAPTSDLEGNPRLDDPPAGGTGYGPPWTDMGAYEYPAGTPPTEDWFQLCCDTPQTFTQNGHTYWRCPMSQSWRSARFLCEDHGTHLVTPESLDENSFVWGMISEDTWIGASDFVVEGVWELVTGDVFSWTYWRSGEPNNNGNEDCAEIYLIDGGWNDCSCGLEKYFVCESPE